MSIMLNTLIDFSGLESFLVGLRTRIDGLQDRVAELEQTTVDHDDAMDEDAVDNLIQQALQNADYADASDILDEQDVQRIVGNMDLLTADNAYDAVSQQVYDMVKDVVREDLDEKDWAESDHDHDYNYNYASVDDHNELKESVGVLESTVEGFADHEDRIADLERRIEEMDNRYGSLQGRFDELEAASVQSASFFKLAVQMLNILRGAL